MSIEIQIFSGKKEETFPFIKLTKSMNGKTGTATFLFIQPTSFTHFFFEQNQIESISLIRNETKIETKDIAIFFQNGKPFLLKTVFLFTNSNEWFDFLNFMNHYSKEKGFFFESQEYSEFDFS